MKTFRFSLSAVQELRRAEEEQAQKNFAATVRACEEAATELLVLERDLENVWHGLRHASLCGMTVDQMRHARAWCCALEEKRQTLAANLRQCQERVDAAHTALEVAARRRESLDRLEYRQRRAHEDEVQREDQAFLDELATRGAWARAELEAA